MCTYALNNDLNGIEISFESKPNTETITALKANGFRWHNVKKLWYAKQTKERIKLAVSLSGDSVPAVATVTAAQPKKNKFGIKVGDIFSASWGYEQTQNDYFQVIALVGDCSVRVVEVYPKIEKREAISGMSEDRYYKIDSSVMLPPVSRSIFIKDQEKGDLKRLKSYAADGKSNPQFFLASYTDAHYCPDGIDKAYESWYY